MADNCISHPGGKFVDSILLSFNGETICLIFRRETAVTNSRNHLETSLSSYGVVLALKVKA